MNSTPSTSCSPPTRAGLTLIEVVAALAILGTILATMVMAKSYHTRQLANADKQSRAVTLTDNLIAAWWTDEKGIPIGAAGTFPTEPEFIWQTQIVRNDPVQDLGARVVRIIVAEKSDTDLVTEDDERVRIVVDLVVPDPRVRRIMEEHRRNVEQARAAGGAS
ncbi:type IV pilus modification PilV family protein [Mucisphaera calidilacus]|uniref:Prepilin-type N-terminal cleavage/methylation domain-containing protein n=1 Tax=Mucisphaera calidilacus TaxID=2527982 RepID=A0A518BUF0_9BACT|nr:prepilin-type N-terminal cleavage/methylation domain-containing protein [Mucisphaera calidilacus]QDU70610.1 hypothetical protein Pan265_04380 [Mucisphaera calidilacus]